VKKIILFILLFSQTSFADDELIFQNKLNSCKVTKQTFNDYEPIKFNSTNNLLRQTGQEAIYCGEKIVIKGTLVDNSCVPVTDAKIYLWQAGCDGKYPYQPLRKMIDKTKLNLKNGSTFTGSGTATSNNKGEFYFTTVYPTRLEPINIRVEHKDFGSLQTQLKITEERYQSQNDDVKLYDFKIVMPRKTLKNY